VADKLKRVTSSAHSINVRLLRHDLIFTNETVTSELFGFSDLCVFGGCLAPVWVGTASSRG
jgi:hypothetical protein